MTRMRTWIWRLRFERQLLEHVRFALQSQVSVGPDGAVRTSLVDSAEGLVTLFREGGRDFARERCARLSDLVEAHGAEVVQLNADDQDLRNDKIQRWHSEWSDAHERLGPSGEEQSDNAHGELQRAERIRREHAARRRNQELAGRVQRHLLVAVSALAGAVLVFAVEVSQAWLAWVAALRGTTQSDDLVLLFQSVGTAVGVFALAHRALNRNLMAGASLIAVVVSAAALRLDVGDLLAGSHVTGWALVVLLILISVLVPLVGARLGQIASERFKNARESRDKASEEMVANESDLLVLRDEARERSRESRRHRWQGLTARRLLRRRADRLETQIRREQAISRQVAREHLQRALRRLRPEIRQTARQLASNHVAVRREGNPDEKEPRLSMDYLARN